MINQDIRIKITTNKIKDAGGVKTWPKVKKNIDDPILSWLWEKSFQIELEALGFEITITPTKSVVSNLNQYKASPELITIKSPEYIKKDCIKTKMKQEFGNQNE